MSKPTAIILAAGANNRFFPFNTLFHKGSLEICGQSLIVRTMCNLVGLCDELIVVRSPGKPGDELEETVRLNQRQLAGLRVKFVIQSEPKGMGDAILHVQDFIDDQMLIVFPSSTDAGLILPLLIKESGTGGSIGVSLTTTPWLFGILSLRENRCLKIVEKPVKGQEASKLKAHGVYLLSKRFFDTLESVAEGEYSFEAALDVFFDQEVVNAVEVSEQPSLKYPWHIFDWKKYLLSQVSSSISNDAKVASTALIDDSMGPVVIMPGAKIGHYVNIQGPTFIGESAMVGDFSFVRDSSIERDAQVGAYTEVVRSVILPFATIHQGYLADSVLGYQTKIGAGLITANKRLDRSSVKTKINGEYVDTGRVGFGALIGHKTMLGVRVTTMPGVLIGSEAKVWPSTTVFTNLEHDAVYKS